MSLSLSLRLHCAIVLFCLWDTEKRKLGAFSQLCVSKPVIVTEDVLNLKGESVTYTYRDKLSSVLVRTYNALGKRVVTNIPETVYSYIRTGWVLQ